MTLLIGTDEAGYGPNLGPLVVAATVWRIADPPPGGADRRASDAAADAVIEHAATALAAAVAATRADGGGPLWADSKQIFRAGAGFEPLERGVLSGLLLAGGGLPADWPALAGAVAMTPPARPPEREHLESLRLPRAADAGRCAAQAEAIRGRLDRAGIGLLRIVCRVVQPGDFNSLLGDGLNKSDILSQVTLDLAAAVRGPADEPTVVWCDRHGGRRRYAGLVSRHFGAPLVQVVEEAAGRSAYAIATPPCRIEFTVGGESRVPVALASMTAKYVRELAMHAFNEFWSAQVPGLRPTAGYPVDAARWRREAAAGIAALQIDDREIWRRA